MRDDLLKKKLTFEVRLYDAIDRQFDIAENSAARKDSKFVDTELWGDYIHANFVVFNYFHTQYKGA